MLYEFLFGLVPFGEDEEEPYAIYQKIQEHNLDFPAWMDKNSKAKDMIGQLLSKNPAKRTGGSNEILKMNSWFSGFDWEKLLSRQLKAPLIPQVQTINNVDEMIKNSREMDDVISMVEAEDEVPLPRKKPTKVKENWDEEF
jgi:cGMP-dependent protein kinase